ANGRTRSGQAFADFGRAALGGGDEVLGGDAEDRLDRVAERQADADAFGGGGDRDAAGLGLLPDFPDEQAGDAGDRVGHRVLDQLRPELSPDVRDRVDVGGRR